MDDASISGVLKEVTKFLNQTNLMQKVTTQVTHSFFPNYHHSCEEIGSKLMLTSLSFEYVTVFLKAGFSGITHSLC